MSADRSPRLLHHFKGPSDSVTSVAFHPVYNRLASASADHSVQLWTFDTQLRCYRLSGHAAAVNAVAWSPGGEVLASGSADRTARIWIPTIRGSSGELRGHTHAVRHVDFNPSGRKLCTASDDKTVKCWSVTQKRLVCTYAGHTNWVRCAKFSRDGQQIASCSDDKTMRLFDVRSGGTAGGNAANTTTHVFKESKGSGRHLAWHPDDQLIAVALTHGRVKVYDARTRSLLQLYECSATDAVTSVAFHASGDYLAVGTSGGEVRILDLVEGRPVYTLLGHEEAVETVAFAGDGKRLATGGVDRQIMLWSFTDTHARNDAENCRPSSSNLSGVESLASSTNDADKSNNGVNDEADGAAGAGASAKLAPLTVSGNPNSNPDLYYEETDFEHFRGDALSATAAAAALAGNSNNQYNNGAPLFDDGGADFESVMDAAIDENNRNRVISICREVGQLFQQLQSMDHRMRMLEERFACRICGEYVRECRH